MKRSTIDAIAAKRGVPFAPDDDPRYREGPTVESQSADPVRPVRSEWKLDGNVEDDDEDAVDLPDTEACPFCGADVCAHHVASLDLTFQEVVGGELFEACSEFLKRRRTALSDDGEDEDLFEETFDALESVLEELPGVVGLSSEWEGGPGQSSAMRHYWAEHPQEMQEAAKRLAAHE